MTRMKPLALAAATLLAGAPFHGAFPQTDLPSITQNRSTLHSKLDQQFKVMDRNRDGRVAKAEFDAYWKRQFRLSDTNHDGKTSQVEARAAAKRLNGGKLPKKTRFDRRWNVISRNGMLDQQQALAWHERLFRQADTDDSGYLGKTEMRRALSAHDWNVGSL